MSFPTVSVIVPTFNRAHYLTQCLDSLLAQTMPPKQVIVVDDGSEDDTRDVVAVYGPAIQYLYKPNGGKPSAVNLAMPLCTGDLVWLFDDDDVALPRAIEDRVRALGAEPDAGFVYSSHHIGSDDSNYGMKIIGQIYVPPTPNSEAFFFELMRSCFFHLNSALVRRDLYRAVGPFDTSLKACEDYDMQIRLARIGNPSFCSSPTFVFRQHGGVRGGTAERYRAAERSAVFRRYSGVVGRKLRNALPLNDYLVPRVTGELNLRHSRRALLQRVHVMANHGCLAEAFDDLEALLRTGQEPFTVTESEAREVGVAMRTGWAYDASVDDWAGFVERVRMLRRLPGGARVVAAIATSLWTQARGYPGTWIDRFTRVLRAGHVALVNRDS